MNNKPLTAIIVGAGRRSITYGEVSISHPDLLKIVGIAEPNPVRREKVKQMFNIPDENCFSTAEELAEQPKFADAVINGTMDPLHVSTSLPLLARGYDILLEKPFAVNEGEMNELVEAVHKYDRKVMICHVLRYSVFFKKIKQMLLDDVIGDVISISTEENVSYHHVSSSYVRGKWSNSENSKTSMLLAKCCHDIDILMWLMGDIKPVSVSSLGSKFQFKPEMAPKGAGTRCLVDCPHSDTCNYSVKKLYLDNPARWASYAWNDLGLADASKEEKEQSLKSPDNRYGRCIYKCDNNVVDHQTVTISFENGAFATHNMIGGTARQYRKIHIIGTKGEITGCIDDDDIELYSICPTAENGYTDEKINISIDNLNDLHGGGDEGLVLDFISYIKGEKPSVSCTNIDDSIASHKCIFLADKSKDLNGMPQMF